MRRCFPNKAVTRHSTDERWVADRLENDSVNVTRKPDCFAKQD